MASNYGSDATDKQIDYILSLASKVQGHKVSYVSQINVLHLTQREKKGGMSKSEASAHIDTLKGMLGQ